jgi:acetyl-CoA synthetase
MDELRKIADNSPKFAPTTKFSNMANYDKLYLEDLYQLAKADNTKFWADLANRYISWDHPFNNVLDTTSLPQCRWFNGGMLNVSYNCLDRHLENLADKTAIISISDSGIVNKIAYQDLYNQVCKCANGLKELGVGIGDRVVIYMPHSIEGVIAMQACARIGAIHSVVFGGFSPNALADRIEDAKAKVIITAELSRRGGKDIPLRTNVDEALTLLNQDSIPEAIIVLNHKDAGNSSANLEVGLNHDNNPCATSPVTAIPTCYIDWHDLLKRQKDNCEYAVVESNHPLFILYTSGSTGKPKGVQHGSAGYTLGAAYTMDMVFDIKPDDIFWCTADIGWITGHTYISYGPLLCGATQVIFEGIPTYPDSGRFWQIIEEHKVSIFYTAPTAIRTLIKLGDTIPNNYDLSSLRLLGSVGEPINPEAWKWYYAVIGKSRCPIVDTWWQTETGANVMTPIPGVTPLKPGSCCFAIPGIEVGIIDKEGNDLLPGNSGYLVIKNPFPFELNTIWNDPDKYIDTYYPKDIAQGRYYVTGDSAYLDHDGYYWIMGRIDDVLNVSGHRLGTMEIESVLTMQEVVAEAAVVSKPDDLKGESVFAFVVCKGGVIPEGELATKLTEELQHWVSKHISPIAKPDGICFLENLPKTRSGKVMRRLLRAIVAGEPITQDISTLENPQEIDKIINRIQLTN